ncbi:MAG: diguanylate cyclase [Pseudomonadota bacterium]
MSRTTSHATQIEQARKTALDAIDLLLSHGLAPSPLNYAVAYEYLFNESSDLAGFLKPHLTAGKPLDDILLQDLYDKYIAAERHKAIHGMRDDLQHLLQTLVQTMADTGSHTAAFQAGLESSIRKLGTDQSQEALKAIAGEMVTAAETARVHNAKLKEHLDAAQQEAEQLRTELEAQRRQAMIDPLTGLFNRRAMDLHMDNIWKEDNDFSLLVLDIDHFKRINDTYGHAIGDVVIRNVADTMRKHIRGGDIAIRFGGEEFMVLLPNTGLEGAVTVAETLRKRIEALRLVRKQDNFSLDPFTISLGVAQRRPEDDRDSLFERADKALYHAKSSGRNLVVHDQQLH